MKGRVWLSDSGKSRVVERMDSYGSVFDIQVQKNRFWVTVTAKQSKEQILALINLVIPDREKKVDLKKAEENNRSNLEQLPYKGLNEMIPSNDDMFDNLLK